METQTRAVISLTNPVFSEIITVGVTVEERSLQEKCRSKRGQNGFAHSFSKPHPSAIPPLLSPAVDNQVSYYLCEAKLARMVEQGAMKTKQTCMPDFM